MVETLTDNRNRTRCDLRHYFDKNGGNLGAWAAWASCSGQKGVIDILSGRYTDEAVMDGLWMLVPERTSDASEDPAEITTDPENYSASGQGHGGEGLRDPLLRRSAMVPMTTTRLTDPDQLEADGQAAGCAGRQ